MALGVESAILLVVGASMFIAPTTVTTLWPWEVLPFTTRIIAAWLLAFGLSTALAALAGDLERLRTSAIAYTAFGVLVLVAVARFSGTLDWGDPVAWAFIGVAVAVAVTGAAGWRAAPAPAGTSRG